MADARRRNPGYGDEQPMRRTIKHSVVQVATCEALVLAKLPPDSKGLPL